MTIDKSKYMSPDEEKQLLAATKNRAIIDLKAGRVGGVNAWAVVNLAISTGLRVSEMATLTIEDVDLSRNCLYVTRVKRRTKCKEPMAVNMELVQHLRNYITWTGRDKGPLFAGSRGPLSAQGLQRIWKAAIRRAGINKAFSIHAARHTMAIDLLKTTGDLNKVKVQLGHASISTTASMYADISFENVRQDVQYLRLDQEQAGHVSKNTDEIYAINANGRKLQSKVNEIAAVKNHQSQSKLDSEKCDACNNILNGQGRKIDSGQNLCEECLQYFR